MAVSKERLAKQVPAPVRPNGPMVPAGDFPFFMSRMRDEFERLFDRMTHAWPDVFPLEDWRTGMTVEDLDDRVVVRAEAPGFEPGDFDLRIRDGRLVLRAKRKEEVKGEDDKVRETTRREVFETVTLPPEIDRDKVEARYANGVLTVSIPKTAEGKSKRIEVKA